MGDTARADALAAWDALARELAWDHPYGTVYEGEGVDGRWFLGGRLNAASNCLDRHLERRRDQVAVLWGGEPGDQRALTYGQLHEEVGALAEALAGLGVAAGDRVALHLGWLPEAVVAMLACARLGAVHALIPVPLPPDALADRLADVAPKVVFSQDGAWRHGVMLPLKARADEALEAVDGIEHTVVVRRTGVDVAWYEGDRWYHEVVAAPRANQARSGPPAASVPSDHPLLVTHLPDRRGRPKAIVHRTAGLLALAQAAHARAFTAGGAEDVLWCAVDLAWGAGAPHGVYGPLLCGGTSVMFEGMLDTPTRERAWEIVERYRVTSLMTTASVWRSLRGWSVGPPGARAASLRCVVTAGEPTDTATRAWLSKEVARDGAVVADGWGQTELGGVVLYRPPRGAGLPELGLDVVDQHGRPLPPGETGELVVRHPWPALMLEAGADRERYWHHPGVYATNDLARREADGEISLLGRIDPVVSVSGQLVSATEVRDVLAEHPLVVAAEVVERTDPHGVQAVVACVEVSDDAQAGDALAADLRACVHELLGGLAQPKAVAFCERLPLDAPRAQLRRALWRLCAGTTEPTLVLSAAQLAAALRAAERELA